ncbi:hypothetical protein KKB69_00245 [Patescibacteria group bacterium]|nr:hypothetical protein [Patescibacteria group bacterium]
MKFLKGLGIIVGLMFGAGAFALPFAIARAGIFWGAVHLLIAVSLTILLLFWYAEIAYRTEGKHRFTGYVGLILGSRAEIPAFLISIAAYYGTLLIYGVLGGLFLHNFFGGISHFVLSLLFFFLGAVLILGKIENIAWINFYLTIPIIAFIFYLLFFSAPFVKFSNFSFGLKDFLPGGAWFFPYGVWLFSFGAFAAIPEARDIYASSSLKKLKNVILVSVLLTAFLYCLFIFSIVGVSGVNTSPDSFSGVLGILGQKIILIGSAMGFLAVFTSFLALGVDLKFIFQYDFKVSKALSWFLVALPPVFLFCLGAQNFVVILDLVGSIGFGIMGIFIIFMSKRLRDKGIVAQKAKIALFTEAIAGFGIFVAIVYQLWIFLF